MGHAAQASTQSVRLVSEMTPRVPRCCEDAAGGEMVHLGGGRYVCVWCDAERAGPQPLPRHLTRSLGPGA